MPRNTVVWPACVPRTGPPSVSTTPASVALPQVVTPPSLPGALPELHPTQKSRISAFPHIVPPVEHRCMALVDLLAAARRILVFTGAGISTGSGIPDFRGPNGVWTRRQPVYFDAFLTSEVKRVEYWDYKAEAAAQFLDAQPNVTHRAIVELERLGRLQAVVTQNIDGLHQAAGTSADRVI